MGVPDGERESDDVEGDVADDKDVDDDRPAIL